MYRSCALGRGRLGGQAPAPPALANKAPLTDSKQASPIIVSRNEYRLRFIGIPTENDLKLILTKTGNFKRAIQ